MATKKSLVAALVAVAASVAACGGGSSATSSGPVTVPSDPAAVSGAITVLTNRTDLDKDGTLAKYAAAFTKVYPKVTVKFESITDYEGEVKIRLNTKQYGDVLLVPNNIARKDYAAFFAPLGTPADLDPTYRFVANGTVNGKVYGLATFGNANGFVYNTDVWKQAGITSWPKTPAEFVQDLQAIKTKTSATPYYTNYHDGWPLTQWEGAVGAAPCDAQATNTLATSSAPWAQGKQLNTVDTLLYDTVKQGLTETDPTTTNWEQSKTLLAQGKIGTMMLGSWAISQMQLAAKTAGKSASTIGYMPFPYQTGGASCSVIAPDYLEGISIHSAHPQAARAWIDWFTDKSGYAQDQGAIPTPKAAALPSTLASFQQNKVTLVELDQAKATQVTTIDKAAEIGLTAPDYRQSIVDAARGNGGKSLEQIFADLNRKWAAAEQAAS
jgi:raffinose/stachyose/melibiose transport system substrate-binding protein